MAPVLPSFGSRQPSTAASNSLLFWKVLPVEQLGINGSSSNNHGGSMLLCVPKT